MRSKKIFVLCLVLTILLIPIITIASIKTWKYTKEGRVIISSPEELKELEDGTKFTVSMPSNNSKTNSDNEKKIIDEKQKNKEKVDDINSGKIDIAISKTGNVDLSNEIYEDKELTNKVNQFMEVFKKYYGKDYSEDLFNKIQKEINEISGDYKIPESSKTLLHKTIDLLNNSKITTEESEIIKYYLEKIDTSYIEDKDIIENLRKAGITID